MTQNAQAWLDQLDARGAGCLAPQQCRDNLLAAEALVAPCRPERLHFAEFPLLGEPCFDMTWCVSFGNMLEAQSFPPELEGAKRLAADMDPKGILGFEYDISEPELPPAAFYYKGWLADSSHAIGRLLEYVGRAEESLGALRVVAKLAHLGYVSMMCGVMTGRESTPVRITAKAKSDFDAASLAIDLSILGYGHLSSDVFAQLELVCKVNEYMNSAPIVYLDVLPDGTLGSTLGIELNGIRPHTMSNYPQLRLAEEWGLADDRWQVLRDAAFNDDGKLFFAPNTLKFRWRDGEPQPVKLYMKTGW